MFCYVVCYIYNTTLFSKLRTYYILPTPHSNVLNVTLLLAGYSELTIILDLSALSKLKIWKQAIH